MRRGSRRRRDAGDSRLARLVLSRLLAPAHAGALAAALDLAGRLGRGELRVSRARRFIVVALGLARSELRGVGVVVAGVSEPRIAALVGDAPRPAAVARRGLVALLVAG